MKFTGLNNVTQTYSRITCEVHKRLVTKKYALVPSILQSARDLDPTLLCCQAAEWFWPDWFLAAVRRFSIHFLQRSVGLNIPLPYSQSRGLQLLHTCYSRQASR